MSTVEQIKAAKWGTGYGSTRHLVKHDEWRPQWPSRERATALARCGSAQLPYLDNDIEYAKPVMAKRPCKRCETRAAKEAGR